MAAEMGEGSESESESEWVGVGGVRVSMGTEKERLWQWKRRLGGGMVATSDLETTFRNKELSV